MKIKLRVSDYARLCGITTAGVYKQGVNNKITIELSNGWKVVSLSPEDYEAKKATYLEKNGIEFKAK